MLNSTATTAVKKSFNVGTQDKDDVLSQSVNNEDYNDVDSVKPVRRGTLAAGRQVKQSTSVNEDKEQQLKWLMQ